MEKIVCRLLPLGAGDGATNMAADEVALESAVAGTATLRFYTWSEATVSLGYFQPAAARLADSRLAPLPFVRRPSGGAALVHHHELTYALALPEKTGWQHGEPWLQKMHKLIARALSHFGIGEELTAAAARQEPTAKVLCFQQITPGDLLCRGSKIAGSAQRKQRGALLQHGGILLGRSPHALVLPGLFELTGIRPKTEELARAITDELLKETAWAVVDGDWMPEERLRIEHLVTSKYSQASWNEKR